MKKKMLFISLALALILTTLTPVNAFAGKGEVQNFSAIMTPEAIDPTIISGAPWPVANPPNSNAWPIVDIVDGKPTVVGWIVDSRSVQGSVSGDLSGASTFTYGGILDNLQSGSMQGTLVIASEQGSLYLAASGEIATAVIGLYEFGEIVAWCGGVGYPVSAFFAQMYNAEELGFLPDGELSFEHLQAWCTAIEMTTGQFFAVIAGDPSLADYPDGVIATLYGTALPILSGLQILGGMYGDALPPLPKTLSAEFSGELRVDAGTGIYAGVVNGKGKFGPLNKQPLILGVSPDQHVESVVGAIDLSGKYEFEKPPKPRKLDKEKLKKPSKH